MSVQAWLLICGLCAVIGFVAGYLSGASNTVAGEDDPNGN